MIEGAIYVHMTDMDDSNKLVYSLFKDAEDRYLKWMNYYSLFNGALLVAYYSIFQLISNASNYKEEIASHCTETSFSNHWSLLALIAILGCIASYCWYLSAIGHYNWIGRWREALMQEKNYPQLNFSNVKICSCCNKAAHYHSTYRVTVGFIWAVLTAWIAVAYCSIFDHEFNIGWDKLFVIVIVLGLIALEFIIHVITGSDLSNYSQPTDKKSIACIIYEGIFKNPGCTILILLFLSALIYSFFYCPTTGIEDKRLIQEKEKSEILFKIEVLNSDSLIFNDSVVTNI